MALGEGGEHCGDPCTVLHGGGIGVPGIRGSRWPQPQLPPALSQTPSLLRSLHMGPGQTPAKWARAGGLHFKASGPSKRCCPPAGLSPARAP